MNPTPGRFPASRSEFLKLVEGTEHAEILRDEAKLERLVIDAMKGSDDPITREIGEGLAGGSMTWQTIATTSAYSGFLDRGLAALQEFDFAGLAENLDGAEVEGARPIAGDRNRRDDEEDLWRGLPGKRR